MSTFVWTAQPNNTHTAFCANEENRMFKLATVFVGRATLLSLTEERAGENPSIKSIHGLLLSYDVSMIPLPVGQGLPP